MKKLPLRLLFKAFIGNPVNIFVLVVLFALAAGIQSLMLGKQSPQADGIVYTHYNNYLIFKNAYSHLIEGKDLYILYPREQWDLYKYSPTFAAFFGFFALLPDWAGLNLWNLLNGLVLFFAVYYLPGLSNRQKGFVLIFSLVELMTSMQSEQSNGFIAGLLILAFGLLEKEKFFWAAGCIVFSAFIKIFGIVGFSLLIFYPKKWKLVGYSVLWTWVLLLVPLCFTGPDNYRYLLSSWGHLLANDHTGSYGISVMGVLHSWSGQEWNKNLVVLAGMVVFLLPFLKTREYNNPAFRLLALCSVLLWMIIFNHKAESPTFVIGVTGVAIWYSFNRNNYWNTALLVFVFLLTCLCYTDLYPSFVRENYIKPYALKALPCILVWVKVVVDMFITGKVTTSALHYTEKR